MQNDTIAAISTPSGVGAVGIIRISGSGARDILSMVWINDQNPVDKFITNRLYYGKISTRERVLDNVLAVYMMAPHSYTGEDVVEIHCHGGTITTRLILESVMRTGARPAEAGEFTKRAFLNGKMDLVQAEAVADIISATTDQSLRLAQEQLSGRLSEVIKSVQGRLKEIKAFIEAAIDFPEEDVQFVENEKISVKIGKIVAELKKLSGTYEEGRLIHDGVKVVIVGKPNVGKSSLLNRLLGTDRAIVHHEAGTTRDTIEEGLNIDGYLFRLIDTAGIRESNSEIERIGIDRAKIRLTEADLAIYLIDATIAFDENDKRVAKEVDGIKTITVLNKIDLVRKSSIKTDMELSAKTGEGMEKLKNKLTDFVRSASDTSPEGVLLTNLRHKKRIDDGLTWLERAKESADKKESAEFIAYNLDEAMKNLGSITGEVTTEDVLNEIFSKFCIGK